jgi:hypothetical protein
MGRTAVRPFLIFVRVQPWNGAEQLTQALGQPRIKRRPRLRAEQFTQRLALGQPWTKRGNYPIALSLSFTLVAP